jgi:hypothetical protein
VLSQLFHALSHTRKLEALRCKVRRKDGKQHRYWSVVENTRVAGGRMVKRHVLYLGEINDAPSR